MELLTLLDTFRNVFTEPSFRHFTLLMLSLWALPVVTGGPVSLVRMWAESRLTQHWDALLRFVRRYVWDRAELSKALLHLVLETVKDRLVIGPDGRFLLVVGVDETTDDHHTAKKIFGVSKHHNHAAKDGQSRYRIGHCWVTLSVLTDVWTDYVRSFAINVALYIGRKRCPPEQYKSKRVLAAEMLEQLADGVGPLYQLVVVGDAYYACQPWLALQRQQGRRVVTRLRSDADLRALPPPGQPKGQRGRPRRYGPRIWLARRARFLHKFEPEGEVVVYGRVHKVRLRKLVGLWHGLPGPVSVVIVRGIGKQPFYLLDTNPEAEARETLQLYAARHAVEQPFADLKCDGGLGQYRGRTEQGVRRFALLAVTAHTTLRLIELRPELRGCLPALDEPWRKPLSHLTTGQIRRRVARMLLEVYAGAGNFFEFDSRTSTGRNSQRASGGLKKAA